MDEQETEIGEYWQHAAAAYHPEDNPHNVWDVLVTISEQTPDRFREAVEAAASAVAARYCHHAHAPSALPDLRKLAERQAAARQHAGLCGKYQAERIAGVDVATMQERAGGAQLTTKRARNQACYDAGIALNARGRGVQLTRKECFTQACRAAWPGDQPLPKSVVDALLM